MSPAWAASVLLGWMLLRTSLLLAWPGGTPRATTCVDSAQVLLGDPLDVRLELRYGAGTRPLAVDTRAWLHGQALRPLSVRGPVDTGGEHLLTYETQIQLFQLGEQRVPPLPVRFVMASGDTVVYLTEPVSVEVLGVRLPGDRQPRDIRPPVRVPEDVPWWPLMAGALLGFACAAVLLWRWRTRRLAATGRVVSRTAVDHTAEFARIAALGLDERGDFKAHYSLLADNLRHYLEENLAVEALERTTDEVICRLGSKGMEADLLADTRAFLRVADLAKFALFRPERHQARQAPEAGIALIRRMDAYIVDTAEKTSPRPRG